jgi:hypothetical protein
MKQLIPFLFPVFLSSQKIIWSLSVNLNEYQLLPWDFREAKIFVFQTRLVEYSFFPIKSWDEKAKVLKPNTFISADNNGYF